MICADILMRSKCSRSAEEQGLLALFAPVAADAFEDGRAVEERVRHYRQPCFLERDDALLEVAVRLSA